MARPAPAADRATEILNFSAAHPTQSFTLSELVKNLASNGASAHAAMQSWCEDAGRCEFVHSTRALRR